MKKSIYLLMSVLLIVLASCNDKDNNNIIYIQEDQLPEKVQTFLQTYFVDNEFISANEVPFYGGKYVEVSLKDVNINFTSDNDWNLVVLANGLPASAEGLIHDNTLKELKEREPNVKITQLHNRFGKEVDIFMSNQKLYSDIVGHEGNVLAIAVLTTQDVPDQMNEYISKYIGGGTRVSPVSEYPKVQKYSVVKGDIYRFKFDYDTFVDFDEKGNWFYVQEEEALSRQLIATRLIKAVPEGVLNKLKTVDEAIVRRVKKINVFDDNKIYGLNKIYGFTMDDNSFVAINSENELLEIPLDAVKEYINKGFNLDGNYNVKVISNSIAPFLFRYSFVITGWHTADPNLIINLTTNAQGDMSRISSGIISTDHTRVTPLPRAVVEMLPHPIANYLDEHYADWKAVWIDCAYSEEYGSAIPQQTIDVMLSVPNNLKTVVFDYLTGDFVEEYLMVQR